MSNRFYFSISFDSISRYNRWDIMVRKFFIKLSIKKKKKKHSDFTFDKLAAY